MMGLREEFRGGESQFRGFWRGDLGRKAHQKQKLMMAKNRKVPKPPSLASMGGVHMTTATAQFAVNRLSIMMIKSACSQFQDQFVIVDMAFALVRMRRGLTSAG